MNSNAPPTAAIKNTSVKSNKTPINHTNGPRMTRTKDGNVAAGPREDRPGADTVFLEGVLGGRQKETSSSGYERPRNGCRDGILGLIMAIPF